MQKFLTVALSPLFEGTPVAKNGYDKTRERDAEPGLVWWCLSEWNLNAKTMIDTINTTSILYQVTGVLCTGHHNIRNLDKSYLIPQTS